MSSHGHSMAESFGRFNTDSGFYFGHDDYYSESSDSSDSSEEEVDRTDQQGLFFYDLVGAVQPVQPVPVVPVPARNPRDYDPDLPPYHNNTFADLVDVFRQEHRIFDVEDTNYMYYRAPPTDPFARHLFYCLIFIAIMVVLRLRRGDCPGLTDLTWGEAISHDMVAARELVQETTVFGWCRCQHQPPQRERYDNNIKTIKMNKDAVYTSVHMHNPRNADLFEDVCKDHLPADDIFVAPHHQPINPEDEDDVVPDQHAAFGIQRATQAVREPAWKDLGLAQLMHSRGREDRTSKGDKAGSYGYYAYYYGYNPNGIAGSVAAAGAATAGAADTNTNANANTAPAVNTGNGSPPPAPARTQRFRGMPR